MKLEQIQEAIPNPVITGLNVSAVGTAFASFLGYLPSIAAALSIVWLALQIWLFLFVTKPWKKKE